MRPYAGLESLSQSVLLGCLAPYAWSFAVLGACAGIAAFQRFGGFGLLENPWIFPTYAWSAQSTVRLSELWAHAGEPHFPPEKIQPAALMFSALGSLAVLLCLQTLAVLVVDRERVPDGLGGGAGSAVKIAVLTVVLDGFLVLRVLWLGQARWAAG
jgi:hypothetical protein